MGDHEELTRRYRQQAWTRLGALTSQAAVEQRKLTARQQRAQNSSLENQRIDQMIAMIDKLIEGIKSRRSDYRFISAERTAFTKEIRLGMIKATLEVSSNLSSTDINNYLRQIQDICAIKQNPFRHLSFLEKRLAEPDSLSHFQRLLSHYGLIIAPATDTPQLGSSG